MSLRWGILRLCTQQMQSQKKNAQLHCNDSTFSLQLRPTPFVQKTSSVRDRMENGSYSINRREIHQFVISRTEANVLGQERRSKDCIWISEVCCVPRIDVITRQIGYLSSRRQLLIPAQTFQGLFC